MLALKRHKGQIITVAKVLLLSGASCVCDTRPRDGIEDNAMPSKILAIHDRARSQSDLKHCLEPAHELTVCDNIELVKEQLSKMCKAETNREPYDLILCAIHLNDSNSGNVIDFLRWTKKHSRFARCAILAAMHPARFTYREVFQGPVHRQRCTWSGGFFDGR